MGPDVFLQISGSLECFGTFRCKMTFIRLLAGMNSYVTLQSITGSKSLLAASKTAYKWFLIQMTSSVVLNKKTKIIHLLLYEVVEWHVICTTQ